MTQTLTITLSEPTALKLHKAVEVSRRTPDEIIGRALDALLSTMPNLSPEAASEVAALLVLSDREVRKALRPIMTRPESRRLESLNYIAKRRTLTESEAAEQDALLDKSQRSALRRAAALAVLAQRGLEVPFPELRPDPTSVTKPNTRIAS